MKFGHDNDIVALLRFWVFHPELSTEGAQHIFSFQSIETGESGQVFISPGPG
jgi:hypothetical protein